MTPTSEGSAWRYLFFISHLGGGRSSGVMSVNRNYLALLMLLWCYHSASSATRTTAMQQRIIDTLTRHDRVDAFSRPTRSELDLREHRLFGSNPKLDCCPTITQLSHRRVGINPLGLLLELYHTPNFTQVFYETICHPAIRDRPCQFIDTRYVGYSRCVQQYSYVYATGRTYGNLREQFKMDFIRVATGCKCQLSKDLISDYSNKVMNQV